MRRKTTQEKIIAIERAIIVAKNNNRDVISLKRELWLLKKKFD